MDTFHQIAEALTFDDILLVPGYSEVLPADVDVGVTLHPRLRLRGPVGWVRQQIGLTGTMDRVPELPRTELPEVEVTDIRQDRTSISFTVSQPGVPVMGHLEGLCHVYVHRSADVAMATEVVLNAKMLRTGVCGAAETLLIDRDCLATHWRPCHGRCYSRRRCTASRRPPEAILPAAACSASVQS